MPTTPTSKILNWGQRYDLGELFGVAALAGHEVAIVSSGIRGARANYYGVDVGVDSPDTRCVQCKCDGQVVVVPTDVKRRVELR